MPRHNGSHGVHHTRRQRGGTTRRTRTPKNTYAAKQATRPRLTLAQLEAAVADVAPVEMSRKNQSGAKPQAPKPPKGGSKPVGTPRGR